MSQFDGIKKTQTRISLKKPSFKKEKIPEKIETEENELPYSKEDVLLSWKAPEYEKYKKTNTWFFVVILVAALLILFFIFTGNFVTAITFIILAIILFYFSQKKPTMVSYALTKDGVAINKSLYLYKHLDSFWIVYEPGETKTLYIKSKKMFVPLLAIQIGNENPSQIRKILLEYLDENREDDEPLSDRIARKLRF